MKPAMILVILVAACGGSSTQVATPAPAPRPVAAPAPAPAKPVDNVALRDVGLDPDDIDHKADPCDDFYRFACGGFLDKARIPPDKAQWGAMDALHDRNEETLHQILERAASDPGGDPVLQKLGTFYGACMDEAAVEKAGTRAIDPLLAAARKVKDPRSLAAAVTQLHGSGIPVLFHIRDQQDAKDATQVIASIGQDGLGMPDRDYYLRDDDKAKALRAEYVAHVERTLRLLGRAPAETRRGAADVMAVETEMARHQKTRVELRDPKGVYNRLDRPGVAKALPALDWDRYLAALGVPAVQQITVDAPAYLSSLAATITKFPPAAWRSYLEFHVVAATADLLPRRFDEEEFSWTRTVTGQKEQQARWKRCVALTDRSLGELLGQPYVKIAFGGESKAAAQQTVKAIADAFAANLATVAWMDDATRVKARAKLGKLAFLIGYPDTWRSYDFAVDRKKLTANGLAARRWEVTYRLGHIGKPVDRAEWRMTPPTVNAYYNAQRNEMVFPAGILQPPFYDVKAGVPVNLGGMGMVVGHELTHGYDDRGAQFDGDGNLSDWWAADVTGRFKERTDCVVQFYDAYQPYPDLHENGKLTLGENIADLGGVKLAFKAYREIRKDAPRQVVADGFTEDQQFFLGVGQAWCAKTAEETERLRLQTNPHSLNRYRVNGALSNLPAFGETFHCAVGSPMRPKNMCTVW